MLKFGAHLMTAAALWFGSRALGLHGAGSFLLVVIGAIGVHQIWERLLFNPFEYLGVIDVAEDDPLMQAAEAQARDTLDRFLGELWPAHREDSIVKFRYRNAEDAIELLWADLTEIEAEGLLRVFIRTPPLHPRDGFDRHELLEREQVCDWSVELRDGTLRGGFTNRALFKISEREEGTLHPKLERLLGRYRELDE